MYFTPFPGESAQAAAIRAQVSYQQDQAFAALAAQEAARSLQDSAEPEPLRGPPGGLDISTVLLLLL